MWVVVGFYIDDVFRCQCVCFGEDVLIFFGIDVVSDYCQLSGIVYCFIQCFQQSGFIGVDWVVDVDVQWVFIRVYGFFQEWNN